MMATAPMTNGANARELTTSGIFKGAGIGAAAGAAVNVTLFLIAKASGVSIWGEFQKGQPAIELPAAQVAIASIVPAVAAALFTLVLNRFTSRPARILTIAGVVLAVVSMGGPMSIPGASGAFRAVLALMHVVATITIVSGIVRFGKQA